jgi:hypothetical protein
MAFRTEALPAQLCKNRKRTKRVESVRDCGSILQSADRKESVEQGVLCELLFLGDSPSGLL